LIANEKSVAKADSVLFLNLLGGPSHLDTLDMKPAGPAETRGSFGHIQTKIPGLIACEYLPKFAASADQYTLIRGIHHSVGDHPQAQEYISSGNRPTPALRYPSIGAVISKEMPGNGQLPPFVVVPRSFEVRGISLLDGLTVEKFQRRKQLLSSIDNRFKNSNNNIQLQQALRTLNSQADKMILSPRTREAFDVGKEPESLRKLFANDDVGQGMLLATRLIEFGVPFVTVSHFGWDTHLDNFTGHKRLIPSLDNGLDAAVQALKAKGLLQRTLVVAMGEFGRTPIINQNAGRDHFPRANWCVMTGGGVQPGRLIGGTNAGGTAPDDSTNIVPDDIVATILQSLGIDHHKTYYTQTGRPVDLVPHGDVIEELY
jgi:hypothetical protein